MHKGREAEGKGDGKVWEEEGDGRGGREQERGSEAAGV